MPVLVALRDGECFSPQVVAQLSAALRADSPGAPATHAEAVAMGDVWVGPNGAEQTELENHRRNESWRTIRRDQVPKGRRIHKLIWVYKVKRDGTAKSRLCVQGTTLEAGGARLAPPWRRASSCGRGRPR